MICCWFSDTWFVLLRYEGRCGLPTNFDSTYCYALGYGAGALLHSGKTGLISSVSDSILLVVFAFSEWYKTTKRLCYS
jgi:6-phosphofructokinase